jgi:hypothetical protein
VDELTDGELNHGDLEELYNGEIEIGTMDVEVAPAEKRRASTSGDAVMAKLAEQTGQHGRLPGPPKKFKLSHPPV